MKLHKCNNCFQMKPKDDFYPSRSKGKSGVQSRCKACNAEVVSAWYRRKRRKAALAHPETFDL